MQGNSRKMASYMIAARSKAASTRPIIPVSGDQTERAEKWASSMFYCDMRCFCIIYTAALMCKWCFSAVAGYSGAW